MRKTLTTAGVVICVALAGAFYLPAAGQIALNDAHIDYLNCRENLPRDEIARTSGEYPRLPDEFDCVAAYLKRTDTIRWRYFFFRTAATLL